jgi:hypothetical protein
MNERRQFPSESKTQPAAQPGHELLDAMQRLRDVNVPPLTEEDVAEEVKAARAARKAQSSGKR